MARPKGRTGQPKRLYLNPEITRNADKLAFNRDISLSELVEQLLAREIAKQGKKNPPALPVAA